MVTKLHHRDTTSLRSKNRVNNMVSNETETVTTAVTTVVVYLVKNYSLAGASSVHMLGDQHQARHGRHGSQCSGRHADPYFRRLQVRSIGPCRLQWACGVGRPCEECTTQTCELTHCSGGCGRIARTRVYYRICAAAVGMNYLGPGGKIEYVWYAGMCGHPRCHVL